MIVFLQSIRRNQYEIIAVLLMVCIGLFNFGWLSLKTIPETPPGYYENIVIEHTQLHINLRALLNKSKFWPQSGSDHNIPTPSGGITWQNKSSKLPTGTPTTRLSSIEVH
ncbi:hypothetical protein [Ewingella americana]|uniref:hypothetical protein n=1 Tax=Ewingella americana TaxID=41202 RepID=UPI0013A53820|nr:hypothetical protein [Ewingella americana]